MGLVLSGGGARGAYEAGVLYHIRQAILKNRHGFDIHAGTSAGALNTCFMTSSAHQPAQQGARLRKIWENLRSSDVYKGDTLALSQMAFRLAGYTTSHLFGFSGLLKKIGPFRGILDTAPFVPFLQKQVDWERLNQNLKEGIFQAVAIATTNVGNGKLELFLNKRPEVEYTGAYRIHLGPIQWYHALASAAVPIVFPPVRIDHYYYVDGSMRQNTPMSPAVQLGADKVLIIGVRYTPPVEHSGSFPFGEESAQPTFTHLAGKLLNSLFLDHIQYDLEQMTRINRIIDWSEKLYGADYVSKLNAMLRHEGIQGDIATRGLKKIESFAISPSENIGHIATEHLRQLGKGKVKLGAVEKFFLRFLEIDPKADIDLLSYLMFNRDYLHELIELGIRDAKKHEDHLARFLSPTP